MFSFKHFQKLTMPNSCKNSSIFNNIWYLNIKHSVDQ